MNWVDSKPVFSGQLYTPDYPFLRSLSCSNLQECWQRIMTSTNSVHFILEAIYSGYRQFDGWFSLRRLQRPIFALYCTCCDWNLPQSAIRVSCRRPSRFITASSKLERRRHTIPESYQKTELYEPQQGLFQTHSFTYPLSAGQSILTCEIDTNMQRRERAWMSLKYENQHSNFEFCKLTAISRLAMN
jgi:hypothetical protein